MAPFFTVPSQLGTITTPRPTAGVPTAFNFASSDLEARSTIVFGIFGTLMATIGIVLASATLRIMYKNNRSRSEDGPARLVSEQEAMEAPQIDHLSQDTAGD